MKCMLVAALFLMLFSVSWNVSFAGPDTAANLEAMFNIFSELEEKVESEEWEDSCRVLDEINKTFVEMFPELKKSCNFKDLEQYSFLFNKLKDSIVSNNGASSQKFYIVFQWFFLDLMDHYEYKVPPVLKIIDKYLVEAETHCRTGNYSEIINEMNEICCFWEKAGKILSIKGVSSEELENCNRMFIKIKSAAKNRDVTTAGRLINKLKAKSTEYLALYK